MGIRVRVQFSFRKPLYHKELRNFSESKAANQEMVPDWLFHIFVLFGFVRQSNRSFMWLSLYCWGFRLIIHSVHLLSITGQ